MVYERRIAAPRFPLLRHALADSVVDPGGNAKLTKARALARIDAAAAILTISEGHRQMMRPLGQMRVPQWA